MIYLYSKMIDNFLDFLLHFFERSSGGVTSCLLQITLYNLLCWISSWRPSTVHKCEIWYKDFVFRAHLKRWNMDKCKDCCRFSCPINCHYHHCCRCYLLPTALPEETITHTYKCHGFRFGRQHYRKLCSYKPLWLPTSVCLLYYIELISLRCINR